MALKIALKPYERIVIAGAVIRSGEKRCDLIIENQVPILREKDLMSEAEANSPCRRIYFVIQLMYFDEENLKEHYKNYWRLVDEVVSAAPSMTSRLDLVGESIVSGNYYKALRSARELIEYEKEVLNSVVESDGCL